MKNHLVISYLPDTAQGSWIAPLSLGASLLMTLLTAGTMDRFGAPKEYWPVVF